MAKEGYSENRNNEHALYGQCIHTVMHVLNSPVYALGSNLSNASRFYHDNRRVPEQSHTNSINKHDFIDNSLPGRLLLFKIVGMYLHALLVELCCRNGIFSHGKFRSLSQ